MACLLRLRYNGVTPQFISHVPAAWNTIHSTLRIFPRIAVKIFTPVTYPLFTSHSAIKSWGIHIWKRGETNWGTKGSEWWTVVSGEGSLFPVWKVWKGALYVSMISKKRGDICIAVPLSKSLEGAHFPVIRDVYAYGWCITGVTPSVIRLLPSTVTVFGLQRPEMTSRVWPWPLANRIPRFGMWSAWKLCKWGL